MHERSIFYLDPRPAEYCMYFDYTPPVKLQHTSCESVISNRVGNSVDPEQLASLEASCSGSTVFSKQDIPGFSMSTGN